MKTKRELYESYTKHSFCQDIDCNECPNNHCDCGKFAERLKKIGAMAILRMFPEKKKPILDVGSKIRFSNGKIGIVKRETTHYGKLYYVIELKDGLCMDFDYLVGKTWEVVE